MFKSIFDVEEFCNLAMTKFSEHMLHWRGFSIGDVDMFERCFDAINRRWKQEVVHLMTEKLRLEQERDGDGIEVLREEKEALINQCSILNSEKMLLKALVDKKYTSLFDENESLKKQIVFLKDKVQEKENLIDTFREINNKVNATNDDLENQLKIAGNLSLERHGTIHKQSVEISNLRKDLEDSRQLNREITATNDKLSKDISSLRNLDLQHPDLIRTVQELSNSNDILGKALREANQNYKELQNTTSPDPTSSITAETLDSHIECLDLLIKKRNRERRNSLEINNVVHTDAFKFSKFEGKGGEIKILVSPDDEKRFEGHTIYTIIAE